MSDLYISISQSDQAFLEQVMPLFEKVGLSVLVGTSEASDTDLEGDNKSMINQAACVLVVWSQGACQSMRVKSEASRAEIRGTLVPAVINDVDIPMPFDMLPTVDLRHWSGDGMAPEFQQLLDMISQQLGRGLPKRSAIAELSGDPALENQLAKDRDAAQEEQDRLGWERLQTEAIAAQHARLLDEIGDTPTSGEKDSKKGIIPKLFK